MLRTQLIIQMSDVIVGLFTVMVFLMIDVICSTENDVVMNVSFVNVSSQNIFVLPFGYCVCKLPSDFMGGLIIDLSRLKGLYQMVG